MTRLILIGSFLLAAGVSRCDTPRTPAPKPAPGPGEFVRFRGTLSEDVDCRLLKTDDGATYSLSSRLPSLLNGAKVCVHGTVAEVSQCLTLPMIEVQSVRSWSSCP